MYVPKKLLMLDEEPVLLELDIPGEPELLRLKVRVPVIFAELELPPSETGMPET